MWGIQLIIRYLKGLDGLGLERLSKIIKNGKIRWF